MAQISINDKTEETELLKEYIIMEKEKLLFVLNMPTSDNGIVFLILFLYKIITIDS